MSVAGSVWRLLLAQVRGRKKRLRWYSLPLALALTLGFAAALGLVVASSQRGQAFLVKNGLTDRFLPGLTADLEVALARTFVGMGLARGDVSIKQQSRQQARVREYQFETPRHLTPTECNLWIARAVSAAGADILRSEEWHEKGGAVVLWLGFGKHFTHYVVVTPAAPVPPPQAPKPRLALVIDDFGYAMNATARGVLELDIPLTIAVLPDLRASRAAFEAAVAHGRPALLHLPMEPEGDEDPGDNPLRVGMSEAEIDALIGRHLAHYETFIGVNNHMGSRATTDYRTMRALAAALERRGLFFFDSLTTPRSVAYDAARQRGIWSARNDLFLDDRTESAADVVESLLQLADTARSKGLAFGIAHPRPYTLEALQAVIPRLLAEGFEFVTLPQLRDEESSTARAGGA